MRLYTTGFRPLGSSTFLEWVDGERLEVVVPGLDRDDSASLGLALGRVLASVHSFDFEKFGFFGPDLRVPAIDLACSRICGNASSTNVWWNTSSFVQLSSAERKGRGHNDLEAVRGETLARE